MPRELGNEIENEIKKSNEDIRRWLAAELTWKEEAWPAIKKRASAIGEACVQSYPILGLEKYLGMADKDNRIAHFPSVKLTNDSFRTKTWLKFDHALKEDIVILNDKIAEGKELARVQKILSHFRMLTGIQTKCAIVSKHFCKIAGTRAKGLGLSAASGGALGKALVEAGVPELANNNRFVNIVGRYLAGSATSSVAGGFSVWLSHKGINSEDCYAVRVDRGTSDVQLVIVPIPAAFKTEEAHEEAEQSWFYPYWAKHKGANVRTLLRAIKANDIAAIGKLAEDDSWNLVHLMASQGTVISWEPATLAVLRHVVFHLRKEKKLAAYCSMDTGPSVAIVTTKKDAPMVKTEIENVLKGMVNAAEYPVYLADLAGPPVKLPLAEKDEIVTETIGKLLQSRQ